MSVLCDYDIEQIQREFNVIEPFDYHCVQTSSYDLHFDESKGVVTPPVELSEYAEVEKEDGGWIIPSQTFALVSTKERVFVPNGLVARFEGKSSLGRIGLFTHVTAGYIDTGFHGNITCELVNMNPYPIKLYDDCSIGQLVFETTSGACKNLYNEVDNHYQHQSRTRASRYEEDFNGLMYHLRD